MTNKISKTFRFDKIAFYGGKRINVPEVEVELEYTDKGAVLSICGIIWNSKHTRAVECNHRLDTMMKFPSLANNALFKKLYHFWSNWHRNDLRTGTVKQDAALREHGYSVSYSDACKHLESIGLFEDDGYRYGSGWLFHEIPEDILKEIETLLSE